MVLTVREEVAGALALLMEVREAMELNGIRLMGLVVGEGRADRHQVMAVSEVFMVAGVAVLHGPQESRLMAVAASSSSPILPREAGVFHQPDLFQRRCFHMVCRPQRHSG